MAGRIAMVAFGVLLPAIAGADPVTFSGSPSNAIVLTGAQGTTWTVQNTGGTTTGTPTGVCNHSPGLSVDDVAFDPAGANRIDAYDNAFTVWVNDAEFIPPDQVDVTAQTLTAGPVNMAGLDVTVEYTALTTAAVLRTVVSFHNPTATLASVNYKFLTNFGSDLSTGIRATSDGPLGLSNDTRWVVTSDDAITPGDAVSVIAWDGPVSESATGTWRPSFTGSPTGTVFACGGNTAGFGVTYTNITVPPGPTLYFLHFGEVAATNAGGITTALKYTTTPLPSSSLTSGLANDVLLATGNWPFFGVHDLIGGGPGAGTAWTIWNSAGVDSLAATSPCDIGPGFSVLDAVLDPGMAPHLNRTDAVDDGNVVLVDGIPFIAPLDATVTASSATAGPVTLSGLGVTVRYEALPASPTLRTVVSLANPTAAAIATVLTVVTNVGSDSQTEIRGTSQGDTTLAATDRWAVTSDDPLDANLNDVVNTHVLFGPGTVAVAPSAITDQAFDCSGSQGLRSTFPVTVPPGATRRLLFFNELHATNAEALSTAMAFNVTPILGSPLVAGLDAPALVRTVNWAFCAETTYGAVECQLDVLTADVVAAVPAGTLRDQLAKLATTARAKTVAAETASGSGKHGPVRRAIARAIASLNQFRKQLKTKKAKTLPQATKDSFTATATAQIATLTSLKQQP